jgi:hypothetical protein
VRNALDEPSPGLGEMLTAINSDEAEAEAAEAEAPAFTDPVL